MDCNLFLGHFFKNILLRIRKFSLNLRKYDFELCIPKNSAGPKYLGSSILNLSLFILTIT